MDANQAIDLTDDDSASPVVPTMEADEEIETIEDDASSPEYSNKTLLEKSQEIFDDDSLDIITTLIALIVLQIEPGQIASFDAIIAIVHFLMETSCGQDETLSALPARSAPPGSYINLSDALCGHNEGAAPRDSLPPPPDTYDESTCDHEATLLALLTYDNECDIERYELPLHRISRHFHWYWHEEELAWGRTRRDRGWNAMLEEEGVDLVNWEAHAMSADEFDLRPLKSWKLFEGQPMIDLVDHYTAWRCSDGTNDGLKGVSRRLVERRYDWEGLGQEIVTKAVPWKSA